MTKKQLIPFALVAVLLSGFFLGFFGMRKDGARPTSVKAPQRVTVSDTVFDTVRFVRPAPRDSVIVRYETAFVPTPRERNDSAHGDEPDSIKLALPITAHTYEGDGFRAYISGYSARLDSIEIYPRTIKEQTQVTTVHRRRWAVGLQAGYGITPKGPQPYLGLGVSFNLF